MHQKLGQFDVEAGYHFVIVEASPDVFQKLGEAQEKYSHWVAVISGQIGDKTSRGFVLKKTEIKIQSFDEKPREQNESTSPGLSFAQLSPYVS